MIHSFQFTCSCAKVYYYHAAMMKIIHTFLVTVSTAIVLTAITSESVSPKTYYVTPSNSNNYPIEKSLPCFTLSQYAIKEGHFFAFNTTLILLPGIEPQPSVGILSSKHPIFSFICRKHLSFRYLY